MRVAQVIESDGPGGAERVLAELSRTLREDGCSIVALVPWGGEGWLARELVAAGIPVERFPVGGPLSLPTVNALVSACRRHRVSLLHTHEFTMAIAGAAAAWRAGIPHVMTMHGSRYYAERPRRRIALRLAATRPASAMVAVSHPLADHLRQDLGLAPDRVRTISNGVRCRSHVHPSHIRTTLRLRPEDRLVLTVGNLYPVKGQRDLIDALGLIGALEGRVHLAIAGRGDLAEALTAHARDVGVSDRVHLLGLRSDIPELLAASDMFVLPSHSEGLPMALLEAMGVGKPIVATNVGDVHRALDFGAAGLLVEPRQPRALATAIGQLLSDRELATTIGKRAAKRVRALYSHSAMAEQYAALYEETLSAQPAPIRMRLSLRPLFNVVTGQAPAATPVRSVGSVSGV